MALDSRVDDLWIGICCCHTLPTCIPMGGFIIAGSTDAGSNGLSQARVGDMTIGYCGHTGIIITGSTSCNLDNTGKARIGDQVSGCNMGVIITGNSTHEVGG